MRLREHGDVRDSRADVGKIAEWWRSEVEIGDGLMSMNLDGRGS